MVVGVGGGRGGNKGMYTATMAAWTCASPPNNGTNMARGTNSPRIQAVPFPSQPEFNLERKTCGEMSKKCVKKRGGENG